MNESTKKIPEKEVGTTHKSEELHCLVILNDDYNTFDYVIEALMDICKHDFEQAYQCATITHYKGKCEVKEGSMKYLVPMKRAILDRGIGAIIE